MKQDAIKLVLMAIEVGLDGLEDYNEIFDTDTTNEDVQEVVNHLKEVADVKEGQ